MEAAGESIFQERAARLVISPTVQVAGLRWWDYSGRPFTLATGDIRDANEAYLREAILNPSNIKRPGIHAPMPSYQGQFNEEQILDLVAYIRSLREDQENEP
jgi:cytochrome c oxidase subunit 2